MNCNDVTAIQACILPKNQAHEVHVKRNTSNLTLEVNVLDERATWNGDEVSAAVNIVE